MRRLRLTKEVIIYGRDFFGKKSYIKFIPYNKPGWYWINKNSKESIPINSKLIQQKARRTILVNCEHKLEIFEHIGSIKWTGLTNVLIESPTHPPYFGRPMEIWDKLFPHTTETKKEVVWQTFKNKTRISSNNNLRYVEFFPGSQNKLEVEIYINYPGLGTNHANYNLPGDYLSQIFNVHSQGWPSNLFYLSKVCSILQIWKHHDRIVWSRKYTKKETLLLFSMHRLGDLLSTIATLDNDKLLAGKVISHCGGHSFDVKLVKKLKHLI